MTERYYSYREFAKIVEISPQTLSDLIKKNEIQVNNAGQVPESEVGYFIRRKLKKGLNEGAAGSYLCITIDKTPEEVDALFQSYEESTGKPITRVTSIQALIDETRQELFNTKVAEDSIETVGVQYVTSILKELVKRTHEAAIRCISRCVNILDDDGSEIGNVPLISLYEMLMYDKLYRGSGDEDVIRKLLSKGVLSDGSSPMGTMQAAYNSIVVSLHIVADDISKRPLISRSDWNPDTVGEIKRMSQDGAIPNNVFIRKFFSMPLVPRRDINSRRDGLEALKILKTIETKTVSKGKLSKVYDIGSKGYCTVFNLTKETTEQEVFTLIDDIEEGYYKTIELDFPDNVMPDDFPEALRATLLRYNQKRKAVVRMRKGSK